MNSSLTLKLFLLCLTFIQEEVSGISAQRITSNLLCSTLEKLSLFHFPSAGSLKNFTSLRTLHLSHSSFKVSSVAGFPPSLETLEVDNCKIGCDFDAQGTSDSHTDAHDVPWGQNLRVLYIRTCVNGYAFIAELLNYLPQDTFIKKVAFREVKPDRPRLALLSLLRRCSRLEILDLEGQVAAAMMLSSLPALPVRELLVALPCERREAAALLIWVVRLKHLHRLHLQTQQYSARDSQMLTRRLLDVWSLPHVKDVTVLGPLVAQVSCGPDRTDIVT